MNNLYFLDQLEFKENVIHADIRLNSTHAVFKGHFPDNPILPGVCLLQILLEVTGKATGRSYRIESAGNIKYLAFINPKENPEFKLEVKTKDTDHETLSCQVKAFNENISFCSMMQVKLSIV